MKRTFCLLCCFVLLIVFSASAAYSECWYEDQNGTHDFEQVDVRKVTCTEDGYYILECRQCGKNVREITEKAIGHKWQKVDSESYPPTCTQGGMTTYVCDNCSQIRTESVNALGHDMYDEAVVRSPTCEIEGRMSIRCSRCGYSDVRDIPRIDHQYGAWSVTVPATDHSMGTRQSVCIECGDAQTENYFPDGTLTRGSKGEAVRSLQQMLLDLGILRDVADGVFGAKTELAVKDYQTTAGFNSDGIAWPQTLAQLTLDWQTAMGYASTPSIPEPAETAAPRTACGFYQDENGAAYIQHCTYHQGIIDIAATLLASADQSNSLRAQKQIRTLWETELDSLYSEWLQRAPVEAQGAIIAAQATYMNYLAVQETVLQQQCDEETAAMQINAELARQCALLCNLLHNEQ